MVEIVLKYSWIRENESLGINELFFSSVITIVLMEEHWSEDTL